MKSENRFNLLLVILVKSRPIRATILKGSTASCLQVRGPAFNALKGQLYLNAGQCPAPETYTLLYKP